MTMLRDRNTVADVARFWSVTPEVVRKRLANGSLPHFKIGGAVRIRREDVEAWTPAPPMPRRTLVERVRPDFEHRPDLVAWVYFIRAGKRGPIKIGWTERTPEERLADLQQSHFVELVLLGAVRGGPRLEHALHRRFAKWRLRGEWFKATQTLLRAIAEATHDDRT